MYNIRMSIMKKKLPIILITLIICSNNFSSEQEDNSPKKSNYYFYNKRQNAKKVEDLKSLQSDHRFWRDINNNTPLGKEKSKSSSSFLSINGSYEEIKKN